MTRGRQKIEAQQKAQAKKDEQKGSQLEARQAAFKAQCDICKTPLMNQNQVKTHYEAKHPGKPIPGQ